ncbi:MAG: hypothetical protein PQJ59_01665 [Spirochaetales bacterium]|nr:hypothetical protein [Spirochaetales bacterium]
MNQKEANAKGTQILSVEMYSYKGETLFRIKSGSQSIHGFKTVQRALDARYDFSLGKEEIDKIIARHMRED